MRILDRARKLGLRVQDNKKSNGTRMIIISSVCGTIWSIFRITYRTPMEVIRIKIRDWKNLCDNIENGSIKIKKAYD